MITPIDSMSMKTVTRIKAAAAFLAEGLVIGGVSGMFGLSCYDVSVREMTAFRQIRRSTGSVAGFCQ
jgi:hypothetical protein